MTQRTNIIGMGAIGSAIRPLVAPEARLVFFCVKAFDLSQALEEQATLWDEDIPFITLSNGYLNPIFEKFSAAHKGRHLRAGMTTMGASYDDRGELKVFAAGAETMWGPQKTSNPPCSPNADELKSVSKNSGWSWQDDMRPHLRRKWIFNATINTLCAALRLKNNGMLRHHKSLTDDVFAEAYNLSLELWPEPEMKESLSNVREQLWMLIEKTQLNENSMARDVRLGRMTESVFMAGVAHGRAGFPQLKRLDQEIRVNINE